jgi:DNA-binding PadR family transcriptional regulator
MTRRRGNLLALAVLSCLSERPMHPYEISQTLRQRGKDQSIKLNYGALYSVVESLAKAGLIQARETVRQGRRPERTIYQITDAGHAEHEQWLSSLLGTPEREYHALEAGLALLGGLPPDEVPRLLEDRVVKLRVELASVLESLRIAEELHVPEIFVVEAQFREAMLRAEIDFAGSLAARIREGAVGGLAGWRRIHELLAEGVAFDEIMRDPIRHLGADGIPLAALSPGTG